MRNLVLTGAAVAALTLGAASAYALPPNSPYAVTVPESVDQSVPGAQPGTGGGLLGSMFEGRSAYVPSAPSYAPDAWQTQPAENWGYYSRGR